MQQWVIESKISYYPNKNKIITIESTENKQTNSVESILCWSAIPEHETCPGVADIPSYIPLEKTHFHYSNNYQPQVSG